MAWESARSPGGASSLRPPTGRPRAFANGLRVRSPSPRNRTVSSEIDFDESSCCDETYVSQLSTRSDTAEHKFSETDESFDHATSPSRSILEKLKNDMNSLELLRQTEFFNDDSENRHYNGGRPSKDFSSPKQRPRSMSSFPRSRSVDVPEREPEVGDSFTSRKPLRPDRSWSRVKRREESMSKYSNDTETDKLVMKMKILEEENERLQSSMSDLKKDYLKDSRKLKEDLHEAKTSEVQLKKELRNVMEVLEQGKHDLNKKAEQHESELKSVRDELRSALERETALQAKIGNLELEINGENGLELQLETKRVENKKLQETILLLDNELSDLREVVDKTKRDTGELESKLEAALKEKQQVSTKLIGSEEAQSRTLLEQSAVQKQLEESRDESNKAKRELEGVLSEKCQLRSNLYEAEKAHILTKEAKNNMEKMIEQMKEDNDNIRLDLERAAKESNSLKQLLTQEKSKAEKVSVGLEKKFSHYEAEINELHIKSLEAERNAEEQLIKAREVFAYEKETLNIKLRAVEKEREDSKLELQRLSNELAKFSSQDVKASAELRLSLDMHESTKTELAQANEEAIKLRTQLSQKNNELVECSTKLSQSSTKMDQIQKEVIYSRELLDHKENEIRELMGMTVTLNEKIDELNTQAGDFHSKMVQYETQLKKADGTVGASENKSKMLNEEISSLQTELSRLLETLETAKNEKEELQVENKSINEKYVNLIQENKELKQKVESVMKEALSQSEELTSALSTLDEMMKYIETSREESDAIIQALEDDLSKALDVKQSAEKNMTGIVEEMKKDYDDMKEKLMKQAELSADDHNRVILELEATIQQRTSEASSLQQKNILLETEIENGQKSYHNRDQNEELEEEKATMAKLKDKARLAEEKLRAKEEENIELKESLVEARMRGCHDAEHKEQGEIIARLNCLLQEKEKEVASLQDKIKALQTEVESLGESKESDWTKQREEYEIKLEGEKQAAEKEIVALKKSLDEIQGNETQLAQLKDELMQKTKAEIELRGELAHKKQQMIISESNEKHLEEHVASLESQIDKLISDYESKLEEMS